MMAFMNQRVAVAEQYVEGCMHTPQAGHNNHATGIRDDASHRISPKIDHSVLSGWLESWIMLLKVRMYVVLGG
jgi:hypothetical protein